MSVQQMRAVLCRKYSGAQTWVDKVNKMKDNQIIAVYFRMQKAGEL